MLASFFSSFSSVPSLSLPPPHPLAWRLPAANTIHLRHITTTSFGSCCTCYTPNGPRWMLTNCWTSFISLSSTVASVCLSLSLFLYICLSLYLSQSVCLSLSVYLSFCPSVCLHFSHFLCIARALHFPFLFVNNNFVQYSICF